LGFFREGARAARWDFLHLGYYDDDCSLAPLEGQGTLKLSVEPHPLGSRRCQQSLPVPAHSGREAWAGARVGVQIEVTTGISGFWWFHVSRYTVL